MTEHGQQILTEALRLPPTERAELVEQILTSFEFPARQDVDAAWSQEAESRIDAYDRGDLKAKPIDEVLDQVDRQS